MMQPLSSAAAMYDDFDIEDLGGGKRHVIYHGRLPRSLLLDAVEFAELWALHPQTYDEIRLHGRSVKLPRWQRAYGKDYHFSSQTHAALPMPSMLLPLLDWVRESIDSRLNGILVIWYDVARRHYIGKHRDSTTNMIESAPIVTVSLGEERSFRLRRWKGEEGEGLVDLRAENGTVFIMPKETNLTWTHEAPRRARLKGRRISITFRAFHESTREPWVPH